MKQGTFLYNITFFILTTAFLPGVKAELPNDVDMHNLITEFKKDPRGPYQAIRWFCPDGTVIPAQERCSEPGGIQHALPKDIVTKLAEEQGIYLGQILAGADADDFWDTENQHSRAKQYQLEKFLQAADGGWILRRARYYRGALQAEDEEAWGRQFLHGLLSDRDAVESQFYLVRQLVKDIPHEAGDDRAMLIRALSKTVADSLDLFMDIRIKIHSKPDEDDLGKVKEFRKLYAELFTPEIDQQMLHLEHQLRAYYKESSFSTLKKYLEVFPIHAAIGAQLNKVLGNPRFSQQTDSLNAGNGKHQDMHQTGEDIANLLWIIRKNLLRERDPEIRLQMMDLSVDLESILFKSSSKIETATVEELLHKSHILAKASAGCGYIEIWEWEILEPVLLISKLDRGVSFQRYLEIASATRRQVEWGTGMVRAVYEPAIKLFSEFEPLAYGFIDDRIRSSVLLALGETCSKLLAFADRKSGLTHDVMNIKNENALRGLNPGFAIGELQVIEGSTDGVAFQADKIYVMMRPPEDLKPVAGIATVTEGNAVSHVQLLARNLGIPNAVLTPKNLKDLKKHSGKEVFYAVSPRGTVVMKPVRDIDEDEQDLVTMKERNQARVVVPMEKLDLKQKEIISMYDLRAEDSGRVCGPKAANVGQLSALFPGKVVSGLVLPFGLFRAHLDQKMPGKKITYWKFLKNVFKEAEENREKGISEEEIENKMLAYFAEFREALHNIPYLPGFVENLKQRFLEEFKVEMGKLPIFIRSDTNMEDLKEFVGAGLNKTAINILEEDKILQSIKEVWASPYRERSFRWRQKYLLNAENVFPSLLLMPSVNVDKSGVMITTGLESGNPDDITMAINWGGAGAVMGQATETYLFKADGTDILLSPAREPTYNYLPFEGGISKPFVSFHQPILNQVERRKLRIFAKEVRQILPGTPGVESNGPFDIELGFWNDQIWLFQVRPFVENKLAQSSAYLRSLDPEVPLHLEISLDEKI